MRLARGSYRFAILIGPYAIKIARIRVIHFALKFFMYVKNGQVGERLKLNGDKSVWHAILNRMLRGIVCNIVEYRVYQTSLRPDLVPTLYTFLGLVNIQVRGESITENKLRYTNPFKHLTKDPEVLRITAHDLEKPENFSSICGRVRLHDYGDPNLEKFLVTPGKVS